MRNLDDLLRYLSKLFAFDVAPAFKLVMVAIGAMVGFLFDHSVEQVAATGALILVAVDTVTGLWAAIKTKKAVTSRLFSQSLTKIFGYLSVVTVAAVCETTITKKVNLPIVECTLYLIIATEGISVLENVEKLGLRRFEFLLKILKGVRDNVEKVKAKQFKLLVEDPPKDADSKK